MAHDVPEIGHLRGLKIFSLGSDFPYAPYWDNGRVHLFSVTANTVDEAEQLEDFYKILDSELLTVVRKHDKVFAPPDKEPPRREITHEIKLVCEAAPIKRRPYPLPPHKLDAMRTQISDLANNGWIEPSVSPWGAPILFVPKKSGELRLCVDFRDLNSVTVDDCFPLPRIDVMLHKARDATLFSTLDLASGFHQIEVEGNSRPLTAFRLPEAVDGSSLWQWKVMPFGLRNAPPTFQRAMTRALNGLDHCATVYIDDILIFSRDKKEHLQHLDQVFTALGRHQYHVRLQKCEFLQKEVKFLGHKLTPEGVCTQKDKVEALKGWKTPFTSSKQTKSFLGAAMWYKSYVAHFATIAAPLFALTSTRSRFAWNEECEQAVQMLKNALSQAPVLARWDEAKQTRVVTDASKIGVGAVLEQLHPEGWRPIAFWSRKLRDPETRYSATDLEWLAVVCAVTRVWNWMLEGCAFTICSDHKALERKLHKSCHDPPINDRQARWIESLTPFSYTFEWVKGENNPVADALSRNPVTCHAVTIVHSLLAGLWRCMKSAAVDDPEYQRLFKQAQDEDSSLRKWRDLLVDAEDRILVPCDNELRTLIISEAHDSPMAGHFGMDRTLEILRRHWHWRGMQQDLRDYVKSCLSCQRAKHPTAKTAGELHPILAERPWQIVTVDFVCGLPTVGPRKLSQILVIVDKFTKYVLLEPCPIEMSAAATAEVFIRRVISEHGVPAVVISDRGPQFASEVWKLMLKSLGTRVALATSHHPQTDGQTERAIQTLLRIIRAFVSAQSDQWVAMLPLFQFAMNNASSATSRYSPFQLLYGTNPVAPPNLMTKERFPQDGEIDLKGSKGVRDWSRKMVEDTS